MGLGIPPLKFKITLESNPLKSTVLVGRLGVVPPAFGRARRLVTRALRDHVLTDSNQRVVVDMIITKQTIIITGISIVIIQLCIIIYINVITTIVIISLGKQETQQRAIHNSRLLHRAARAARRPSRPASKLCR